MSCDWVWLAWLQLSYWDVVFKYWLVVVFLLLVLLANDSRILSVAHACTSMDCWSVMYVWALLSYSMSMSNRTLRVINGSHYTQLCLLHYQLIRSFIIDTMYSISNSFCCSSMIRQENTTPNQINIKKRTVSFFCCCCSPIS